MSAILDMEDIDDMEVGEDEEDIDRWPVCKRLAMLKKRKRLPRCALV